MVIHQRPVHSTPQKKAFSIMQSQQLGECMKKENWNDKIKYKSVNAIKHKNI